MIWELLHPRATADTLGFIPSFLSEDDPDPAWKQIHKNYGHGGGWRSQDGFALTPSDCLRYPGDPPLQPLARTHLRDERILFYPYSFVAIIQPDRSFDVARID